MFRLINLLRMSKTAIQMYMKQSIYMEHLLNSEKILDGERWITHYFTHFPNTHCFDLNRYLTQQIQDPLEPPSLWV